MTEHKLENVVIEGKEEKLSSGNRKYFKLTADGKTFSVWEEINKEKNPAYTALFNNEFKLNDVVSLTYTTAPGNYNGKPIEYKNIIAIETGDLEKQNISKSSVTDDKMSKEEWAEKDRRISRMNCISNALEFCKINKEQITQDLKDSSDKLITTSFVLGVAKQFERYVYENQESDK